MFSFINIYINISNIMNRGSSNQAIDCPTILLKISSLWSYFSILEPATSQGNKINRKPLLLPPWLAWTNFDWTKYNVAHNIIPPLIKFGVLSSDVSILFALKPSPICQNDQNTLKALPEQNPPQKTNATSILLNWKAKHPEFDHTKPPTYTRTHQKECSFDDWS